MIKRQSRNIYLCVFFSLLALMSIPKTATEQLRGTTIAALAPLWKEIITFKAKLANYSFKNSDSAVIIDQEELQQLRLENILLQAEIKRLKESFEHELRLINLMTASTNHPAISETASALKKRHRLELQKLLQLQLQAIPGRVIFRSPNSWNSFLWIDVGTSTNDALGTTVIAKNSPVIIGTSIIGIIDYVGKNQARVQLITDAHLSPSVRALRTSSQNIILQEKIHSLLQLLENNRSLLSDTQEQEKLIHQLKAFSSQLPQEKNMWNLAKGEVHGASKPLWRSQRHLLHGIGFNYDFSDGDGIARDLRTGAPIDSSSSEAAIPILKSGDLLITTGMDGVFPPDLLVGEITHVYPLKEGDYYYEIDAIPTVGNFDEISLVFVIPPIGFNTEERPLPPGWD